ncbi:hypothetical protein NC652_007162 [Populus alba x Populus x berolinensis]|nr:hypothetical protein NC652_007162 [Populus alba x Populus x berolinensis]
MKKINGQGFFASQATKVRNATAKCQYCSTIGCSYGFKRGTVSSYTHGQNNSANIQVRKDKVPIRKEKEEEEEEDDDDDDN